MVKKINQETIIRFGFFLIVWMFIYFFVSIFNPIFGYNYKSERDLTILFWVFLMFPIYIYNIITNIDKLNLLDSNYFWTVHSYPPLLGWISGGLYFSFVLTLLCGDNEKIKNKIWKFHFCFFTYAIILKAVDYYFKYRENPKYDVVIGSGNLVVLLSEIIVISTNIYILTHIKKDVDFEFLKKIVKKYFFVISEFLLALFVALIFNQYLLAPDANIFDRFSVPITVLFIGLFIFLGIQLIRIRFNERQ